MDSLGVELKRRSQEQGDSLDLRLSPKDTPSGLKISTTWPRCVKMRQQFPCRHSSFRVWESFVLHCHDFEQELHTPLEIYVGLSPGTPLYMSSCNFIIIIFSYLIEPYADFLTLIIIHTTQACLMSSQEEPFYIYFAALFPNFYREGTFPWVSLSYTCFLALSIGMFCYMELVRLSPDTILLLDL